MDKFQIHDCLSAIQKAENILKNVGDNELFEKLFNLECEITRKYASWENE